MKTIENLSAEKLVEEIERLKARKSLVAVNVIPRIDRMISAVARILEHQQIREAGGPSLEALDHIQAEVDKRRKRDNKVAAAIVHLEAKQIRRTRLIKFAWAVVLLGIVTVVAILANRS